MITPNISWRWLGLYLSLGIFSCQAAPDCPCDCDEIGPEPIDRTAWQQPGAVIDILGNLEEKVVADIGAGEGLGRALARKFALEGFDIAAVSRREAGSAAALAAV
ncbi:MAG: hypothetical protein AAFR97_14580, partial [Bacteroidota bacterium]